MSLLSKLMYKLIPLRLFRMDMFCAYFVNTRRCKYKQCGEGVELFPPLYVYPHLVSLGHHCRLQPGVRMISNAGELVVGDYSAIGAGTTIIPGSHLPTVGMPHFMSIHHLHDTATTIRIAEDCWVGAGCYLLSHAHIQRGAVVAAASVVTKEIPPYAVVGGSPAKIIGVKFSLEQILEHERAIYPPEKRFTREQLEEIFATHYQGKKVIKSHTMNADEQQYLRQLKQQMHIPIYE